MASTRSTSCFSFVALAIWAVISGSERADEEGPAQYTGNADYPPMKTWAFASSSSGVLRVEVELWNFLVPTAEQKNDNKKYSYLYIVGGTMRGGGPRTSGGPHHPQAHYSNYPPHPPLSHVSLRYPPCTAHFLSAWRSLHRPPHPLKIKLGKNPSIRFHGSTTDCGPLICDSGRTVSTLSTS
jgi:hypothetical protein